MAHVGLEQAFDDVRDVGQVAVVGEDDAVGRVHVKGLGFGDGGATGGGITDVSDAHGAEQAGHIAGVKNVGDKAVSFVEVEALFEECGDTRGVLAAVLEHGKRIVDDLAYRTMSENAHNTAHYPSLRVPGACNTFGPMIPANGDVKPCEDRTSRCFGCLIKDNLPACAEPTRQLVSDPIDLIQIGEDLIRSGRNAVRLTCAPGSRRQKFYSKVKL